MQFASHLPAESSDDDDVRLLSLAREAIASDSSDGGSWAKADSEESLDLSKFSSAGDAFAVTADALPPEAESEDSGQEEGHGFPIPKEDEVGDFAGGWQPGLNVGSWVGRQSPLSEQAQVLVANVYLVTTRLAGNLSSALARAVGRRGTESRPLRVASALLGLSRAMVSRCVHTLSQREWTPQAAKAAGSQSAALPIPPQK